MRSAPIKEVRSVPLCLTRFGLFIVSPQQFKNVDHSVAVILEEIKGDNLQLGEMSPGSVSGRLGW